MSNYSKHYSNNNNNNYNHVMANDTFRIRNPSKVQAMANANNHDNNNNNIIFDRILKLDSAHRLGAYTAAAATSSSSSPTAEAAAAAAAIKNMIGSNNNNTNMRMMMSTPRRLPPSSSAAESSSTTITSTSSSTVVGVGGGGGNSSNANTTTNNCGPSLLFRLIAAPPPDRPLPWDLILQRARSHPHEACVYDSNAGGHVYALHRLLRRTGGNDDGTNHHHSSSSSCSSSSSSTSPPLSVVEAVMRACPRAVTRKQALIDEDRLLSSSDHAASSSSSSGPPRNEDAMVVHFAEGTVPNNENDDGPNYHHPPRGRDGTTIGYLHPSVNNNENGNAATNPPRDIDDHDDDVRRYEYPLAIACEYEQSGDIIRLLASSVGRDDAVVNAPAYRSEVFRSLDFVSLPNSVVRILLEEYAGCVLERGHHSEVTEGDDDDCPLEQVLFWWDDPDDMMGMEEAIREYPRCTRRSMKDELANQWEKLGMMLYAASAGTMKGYHSQDDDDDDDEKKGSSSSSFQVLHRVLRIASEGGIGGVRFPNDVTRALLLLAKFIRRERSSMFRERDESGSFPIHIAVSGKGLFRHQHNDDPHGGSGGRENENNNAAAEEREVINALNGEQQQHAPPAGGVVRQQEEDGGEGEDEHEADDNDEEEDDEDDDDIDTSTSSMDILRLLLDQHPASIRLRDSQSGSLPVHLALQHNPLATNVIEHLLERFPRSATMPDGNGRLAIHLALIHKSPTWKTILDLSPAALETRDPVTGLLPFQLAAMIEPGVSHDVVTREVVDTASDDTSDLSTCFYLLRMSPCLASGLADIIESPPRSLIEQQIMFRCKPRVTKLEEENERLRRRVDELELKLRLMQMGETITTTATTTTTCPRVKKRKSSSLRDH